MPHVSRHTLKEETRRRLSSRIVSFLESTDRHTRKKIFQELLTKTERLMVAKRLSMIYLIHKGVPTHTISKVLRMSPSTVARFETRFERGNFTATETWLRSKNALPKLLQVLADIASVPFEAQRKSLSQMLRETDEKHWG